MRYITDYLLALLVGSKPHYIDGVNYR